MSSSRIRSYYEALVAWSAKSAERVSRQDEGTRAPDAQQEASSLDASCLAVSTGSRAAIRRLASARSVSIVARRGVDTAAAIAILAEVAVTPSRGRRGGAYRRADKTAGSSSDDGALRIAADRLAHKCASRGADQRASSGPLLLFCLRAPSEEDE